MHTVTMSGPGSSVGIATDYGLESPGIESRWGRDFSHKSRPALGPTQPLVRLVRGLSRGVKRPGRGADHPLLLVPRLRMGVYLYLYLPFKATRPVIG
jgi:hypothetical protein